MERIEKLTAGMAIVWGGDRITRVSEDLAATFQPGDSLVVMQSDDRRLQFEPVSTVLQPNTTTTVGVPVRAIGSGNVSTQVDILGPVGQVIGTGTEINIRVRADWENVGTAIIAGVFLLILIVGIIRSARRGTRTPPIAEADLESEE